MLTLIYKDSLLNIVFALYVFLGYYTERIQTQKSRGQTIGHETTESTTMSIFFLGLFFFSSAEVGVVIKNLKSRPNVYTYRRARLLYIKEKKEGRAGGRASPFRRWQ
jgi:hypothetical protein